MKKQLPEKMKMQEITLAAMLCAVGVVIPLFSPIKIMIEPASFTLASHVAIFIAMFLSPMIGVVVALGTAIGFFMSGFPMVIVARAATHLVFALVGSFLLANHPQWLVKRTTSLLFSFLIGILHAICEMLVVLPFYFGKSAIGAYDAKGIFVSIGLLVGLGTLVHSMVDFEIARHVYRPLQRILPKKIR